MENKIQKLADIIKNSKYLVFFTGAGVSTDSGLKSFRGKDGLYSTLYKGKYRPEEVLSSDFFYSHRNIFMEYVENELNINGIKPNKGHLALAELERIGLLKAVITQNIDDLHQMAGNKNVLELHGSLKRWYCLECGKTADNNFSCECGGIVRPDVTLYGENLNQAVVNEAIYQLEQADTLIVAGTSLTVYPAAYYLRYFKGKNLVIINNENTQYDSEASLVLNSNFADTMDKVINIIKMGA
ncbi:NAD-dependent protein deacylase [Fusobacterium animalis]|jgi:NAD-dependent deacetylase|uniref:NAD-dependent protein deacetylase n=1 Tax=Fusobacterium nucleatum TaxID=851 RepID=A0A133NQU5_FUSNU|nr:MULTISPECIES: NAD-dependent protein deacylase [Fusobacterium]KXA18669.1 putative NAD-dependent deacetylase [Fusobacterium nucleatum]PCR86156.1 NAD-dependent protein deacylase [Fusobacterium nucleatum]PZA05488.1 NAD-dependent protein deacylase [Fusobacterium nucleatum]QJX50265.1 NAD-dependent protein deacylase [Fusobacterium nucleatum]QYR68796.1 NAD-dependent protein deacylase [Fusobacterium animalis]